MTAPERDIPQWPPPAVHREVLEQLELVLRQVHEDLQLLKLHLFTEHLLNPMCFEAISARIAGTRSCVSNGVVGPKSPAIAFG
jgi:hypothetical protein